MAVWTVTELAQAIRLDTPLDPAILPIVTEIHAVCLAAVNAYAPDADDDTKSIAMMQMGGYLFDDLPARRRRPSNAFDFSGAKALLSASHDPVIMRAG